MYQILYNYFKRLCYNPRAALACSRRRPTEEEKKTAREYINKLAKNRQEAHEDVQWAILNSKEFLFQH